MRLNDIFVISSKGTSEEIPSFLVRADSIQEVLWSSENLICKTIESIELESVSKKEGLLPFVDIKGDYFSFKPSIMEDVFKDLYVSLMESMCSLSFEDFCSLDIKERLAISSSDTPIIVWWDDDYGTFIGVLEDFLRMPNVKDGEYMLHAVFSRHC